jgi:AhpD family alkylhydroperoxidase
MGKVDSLCSAGHLAATAQFAQWAPQALEGFQALASGAFASGALSVREKELIAFGCAHVLRCPYCIDYHHGLATGAGASRSELTEAVWVAIAMAAAPPLAHASIALALLDGKAGGDYYATGDGDALDHLGAQLPAAAQAYNALQASAFETGAMPGALKALTAVACAHNLRCPYTIERSVERALAEGCSKAAIAEAIFVAIEMAAGACLGHAGLAAALMA